VFERKRPYRELEVEALGKPQGHPRIIVFGLGRYGSRLLQQLAAARMPVLGVDFDPGTPVRTLRRSKLPVRFGDGEEPQLSRVPAA